MKEVVTEAEGNMCVVLLCHLLAMDAYYDAADSMMRLNRTGAELMHKYRMCCDMTCFY